MAALPKPPAHLVHHERPRGMREVLEESGLYGFVRSSGDIGSLAVRTVREAVRPPYPWFRDAVTETALSIRRCAIPLVLSMFMFTIGIAFVLLGRFIVLIGAIDRVGGGVLLAFTREQCIWVTGMVFGGVAGSAMTADIAARKNREELDALAVLGVERTRSLVVPRVAGSVVSCVMLGILAMAVTWACLYAFVPLYTDVPRGVAYDSMLHSALPTDILAAVIKFGILGFLIGVISCHMGLSTKPGTEGVGRAVNQNVVLCYLVVWVINGITNLAYFSLFPTVADFKG